MLWYIIFSSSSLQLAVPIAQSEREDVRDETNRHDAVRVDLSMGYTSQIRRPSNGGRGENVRVGVTSSNAS